MRGLPDLEVEQAFELADASAERSAAGCTVKLNKEPVIRYLNSNIALLKSMIRDGYQDSDALKNRIEAMEKWLADPQLLEADPDAEYAAVIDINLEDIKEPVLCCPNDPDDVKVLSEVAGTKIDEVFIGSCMTNIGHYRAAARFSARTRSPCPPSSGLLLRPAWTGRSSQTRDSSPPSAAQAQGSRSRDAPSAWATRQG